MKAIILNEFKSFFRNSYFVVLLVMFPLILVFFLGSFLENVETCDHPIGEITVGCYSDDSSFMETIKKCSDESDGQMTIKEYDDCTPGNEDCFVSMEDNVITIYEGVDVTINTAVKAVVNGITSTEASITSVIKNNPAAAAGITVDADKTYITTSKATAEMTMTDYYAITMTILTAFFGALVTSMSFNDERTNKTFNRIMITPVKKYKIFIGKVIGTFPQAFFQVTVTMVASSLIFKAKYGSSFKTAIVVYLILLLTAMVSNAIGILLGAIFKPFIAIIIFIVTWLMLFFGGIFAMAMAIEPICNYMPPLILKNAILNYTLFGRGSSLINIFIIEVVILVAVTITGALILQRKQEDK